MCDGGSLLTGAKKAATAVAAHAVKTKASSVTVTQQTALASQSHVVVTPPPIVGNNMVHMIIPVSSAMFSPGQSPYFPGVQLPRMERPILPAIRGSNPRLTGKLIELMYVRYCISAVNRAKLHTKVSLGAGEPTLQVQVPFLCH